MQSNGRTVAGVDVGNGWVKAIATGRPPVVFQATAAPADAMSDGFVGHRDREPLIIGDRGWYAGFPPGQADYAMPVYKGVALSDEHRALFLQALDDLGCDLDLVVVGLPGDQAGDPATRAALKTAITGKHVVRGRTVKVGKVGIFDQPRGSARQYIEMQGDKISDQTILIVDIGWGTTDLTKVTVTHGERGVHVGVAPNSTTSYWQAMSQVCEAVAAAIRADHGMPAQPETIGRVLQRGDRHIIRAGKDIDLSSYLDRAASGVVSTLANAIRTKLRTADDIDMILLTGGGAVPALASMQASFKDLPITVMPDASLANARGFALLAASHAG